MRDRARRWIAAGLCGLAAALHGGAAGAAPPRVGVVVATRVNLPESQADALASHLARALRRRLDVDVIAGVEARRRLPPAGIPEDCVARPECVRDVATRLDGDQLLFLFVVRIGPRYRIDVTWADARSGAVNSRPALVVEEGGADAERVFSAAARDLMPAAAPRVARVRTPAAVSSEPVAEAPAHPTAPAEMALAPEPEDLSVAMPVPSTSDLGRRRGRHVTAPAVVAGVVATAALATGVGFAVAARQDYNALEEDGCDRNQCSGVDARVDRMERRALVADVLFAGAGAAALTTIVLYLTSTDEPSESHVHVGGSAHGAVVSYGRSF